MAVESVPSLNLRHLRAFCEVADLGGVSAAAPRVHLSQPAVTQAIAKFEMLIGTSLFERSPGGMRVNSAGAMVRARAGRALRYLRQAGEAAAKASGQRRASAAEFDQSVTASQLRGLLAISEAPGFAQAADRLGVSHPSLHRIARDLESAAGVRLFVRLPQGLALTEAALRMAECVGLFFAEMRQAFDEIGALSGPDRSLIVIGSEPMPQCVLLPAAVNALTADRPDLRLRIVEDSPEGLLDRLRRGQLDLVLRRLGAPAQDEDLDSRPLFQDRLAVFARKGHPLAGGAVLGPDDLAEAAWTVASAESADRAVFDSWFAAVGLAPPTRVIETGCALTVREYLLGSDRLALVSSQMMAEAQRAGQLVPVPVNLPGAADSVGVTLRPSWVPTATQSVLLDILAETAASIAPAISRAPVA